MNTREWLTEQVIRLRKPAPAAVRSTQERLKARLRQGEEALSPSALRHKLDELKAIVDPLVSEVEGGRREGQRLLVGRVIARLEDKGLKLVGLKLVAVSRELAEQQDGHRVGAVTLLWLGQIRPLDLRGAQRDIADHPPRRRIRNHAHA